VIHIFFYLPSFRQGHLYRYDISNFDSDAFVSFATKFYVNVKAERVPAERTWFDKSTDYAVQFLKDKQIQPIHFYIGFGALSGLVSLYFFVKWCLKRQQKAKRFRDSKDYFKFD
jgi:hypothetical protein